MSEKNLGFYLLATFLVHSPFPSLLEDPKKLHSSQKVERNRSEQAPSPQEQFLENSLYHFHIHRPALSHMITLRGKEVYYLHSELLCAQLKFGSSSTKRKRESDFSKQPFLLSHTTLICTFIRNNHRSQSNLKLRIPVILLR